MEGDSSCGPLSPELWMIILPSRADLNSIAEHPMPVLSLETYKSKC
uniref:Uncharacterized protein n=1 Tax=Nelumbo nucifera TaxID=4432 RepID=A0A822XGA9_NELNU|nr:TPA_asm: hypothetical protein HUJ06_019338 [Nelumbo nucifera]